jgi:integrase
MSLTLTMRSDAARRAADADVDVAIGDHSFRGIGLTDYLDDAGRYYYCAAMAGHANIKTTQVYDRR